MKPWSNLARIVYKRTYARRDNGVLENWEDTVERAVMANVRGRNVTEQEVKRLIQLAVERKSGFAGRGWWFSGAPSHERIGGAALNNCFTGDVRFVSREGTRSFHDTTGLTLHVLDEHRSWIEVTIQSHGKQAVREVVLQRYGKTRVIKATNEHVWYAKSNSKATKTAYTTETLPISGYIASFTAHTVHALSYEGIAHGITYGDGTYNAGHGCSAKLCGPKVELQRFFARDIREHDNVVSYMPRHYKDLPDISSDTNYLAGFLAGIIATDGSVHSGTGQVTVSVRQLTTAESLKEIATVLGIDTGEILHEHGISNFSNEPHEMHVLPFLSYSLPEYLLVRSDQRSAYRKRPKTTADDWKVVSVSNVVGEEDVFCVNVPTTHTFTLEGNIFTGNCWFLTAHEWENYVLAQDLLMLGGGVGMSVEHKYVSKLPKVKKGVEVVPNGRKDADIIVPDSREGWCALTRRVLESFFSTGRSFSYSTVVIRGHGEDIKGFGGVASGPLPLVRFVETLCSILSSREGKHLRPIDAADILTATGEMVVSGNVRRSAIIILGDPWDKDYLRAKRWDLGPIPSHRAFANYSVITEDIQDVHPSFWLTYEHGEPFGIINLANAQKYGRMGELQKDTAQGVNPCGESLLEDGEPCTLVEQALCNLDSEAEFIESSRLWFRAAKRITLENYHHTKISEVVKRNRRVGVGITGCLASPLFNPETLDKAYSSIQEEDATYSKELSVPRSIRTTLVKPSGTMSKVFDCDGYEGIHPSFSKFIIQRIRFASSDPLITKLRTAGHYMEPTVRFDGSFDHGTQVVDFYVKAPDGFPVADEDWTTWRQLDVVKMVQRHWCDQSASVTVYYRKEDIPQLKTWLAENLQYIKTISFLCASDHGFKQAPKEAITEAQYEKLSAKIKPIEFDEITDGELESQECAGGVCPVK